MEIALVYLVGGISSRFGGRIKQFAKVGKNGETLIEHSLNQALKAGFSKIVFIVGNRTEAAFKEKFGNSYKGVPVFYALQRFDEKARDKPWGTVDALCSAKHVLDCPFVICNGDDIYGESSFRTIFEHLSKNENEASVGYKLAKVLPENGNVTRGIFREKNGKILSIKETFNLNKKGFKEIGLSEDDLCSMNLFGLHTNIVELLQERLNEFKKTHDGDRKAECLLPEEISRLLENGKAEASLYPADAEWLGITNPEDEEIVREIIRNSS